jgi:cytochrome c oxidase subunit 2
LASGAIFAIFIVLAVVAIGAIVFLGNYRLGETLPQASVTASGYVIRRYWLGLTLVVAVAAFIVTLSYLPYASEQLRTGARHYFVVARQYGFTLPSAVPLGTPVVFDVTSADVNHGFGIFTPDGKVFAQVQAMPDYVNHLQVVFAVPGHYNVRCMEYCGIAHAAMQGSFEVR